MTTKNPTNARKISKNQLLNQGVKALRNYSTIFAQYLLEFYDLHIWQYLSPHHVIKIKIDVKSSIFFSSKIFQKKKITLPSQSRKIQKFKIIQLHKFFQKKKLITQKRVFMEFYVH